MRRVRRNTGQQLGALTMMGVGGYGTYLFGWFQFVGKTDATAGAAGLLVCAPIAITGAIWELTLLGKRGKRRQDVREAADRVLGGGT